MDNTVTFASAFILGLFSTIHCVGMCGGIIGALSLGLPDTIRNNKIRMFIFVTVFNIGRVISYMLAGLIAGVIGMSLFTSAGFEQGHVVLRYVAAAVMIAVGLYLSGWLPQLAIVEKAGVPLWRKLEPLSRKLLPVTSLGQALGYGLIWGWLPCGLVYFVLLSAMANGDAIRGALIMYAFGMGTLPTLISAGLAASWLRSFATKPLARHITGLIIIIMAIASLFVPMAHHH